MPVIIFEAVGDGTASSTITDNADGTATTPLAVDLGDGTGYGYVLDTADLAGTGALAGGGSPGFATTAAITAEGILAAVPIVGLTGTVDLPPGEGTLTAVGRVPRDITVNVLAVTGRQIGITVHGRTITAKASI